MNFNLNTYRKLNGNTLKVIACICMFIDHIGAAIILPAFGAGVQKNIFPYEQANFYYKMFRFIGRSAFPIFAYLLVEGFYHTKNRLRYALSLFIFALISEYPYDLAFNSVNYGYKSSSNVCFSLLIGLLVIWAVDYIRKKKYLSDKPFSTYISPVLCMLIIASGAGIAHFINCDYSEFGIAVMVIFYYFRSSEPISLLAGFFVLCGIPNEYRAFPAFILLFFYNKKRGKDLGKLKYLFYIFYPAHLIALILIRLAIYGI